MFSPIFGKFSWRPFQRCVWSLVYLKKWRRKNRLLYFCSMRSCDLIFMVCFMFSPILGKFPVRPFHWYGWTLVYLKNWSRKNSFRFTFIQNALARLFLWFDSCSAPFLGKFAWSPSGWHGYSPFYLRNMQNLLFLHPILGKRFLKRLLFSWTNHASLQKTESESTLSRVNPFFHSLRVVNHFR